MTMPLRPAVAAVAWLAFCLSCMPVSALASPSPSPAQDGATGKPALADVIACRLDVPAWVGFAAWFTTNPQALVAYGLTRLPGDNGFLADYRLAHPISVFGRTTDRVAFTAAGVMAVFAGVRPQTLARELGIAPVLDLPEKYLGERLIAETPLAGGDPALQARGRIALNVSTVTSHPGMTLAGCSYQLRFAE